MVSKIKKLILNRLKVANNNKGFSLLEIMIVVTIMSVIGVLVIPRFMEMPKKARVAAAKNQMKSFETALQTYNLENSKYPTTDEGLQALVTGKYIKKIPKDPWGNPYIYNSPGENDPDFEIMSLGTDGKEGGTGYDADIKSWE